MNPSGKTVDDPLSYKFYTKDNDGYYFEMEVDHPDPWCWPAKTKGYGWRSIRESDVPQYIKDKLCEPVPV